MSRLPRNEVIVGDAAAVLQRLPAMSVDMALTSPPYFRLRDYGVTGQLGLEGTVDDWVAEVGAVCREIGRLLTPTGSLWLNLGDAYATHPREGAPRKSLLLGPERLALALVADGWLLRNKIVWQKTNPMPSPVRDRLSCTWEAVYVLARSPHYFFDLDAVRVPHRSQPKGSSSGQQPGQPETWRGPNAAGRSGLRALQTTGHVGHPLGKNPGDVWALGSSGYRGPHPATFPVSLAARAIRAGCPEARCQRCHRPWRRPVLRSLGSAAVRGRLGPTCDCRVDGEAGLVLDPFMGVGTTGLVAEELERGWLGVELNPTYASAAEARIAAARQSLGRAA